MAKKTARVKPSDITAAIGDLSKKASSLKEARAAILRELHRRRDEIDVLLRGLGEESDEVPRLRRGGRPRGYKTSSATRAKLRAAWRRRKEREGTAGKSGKSAAKRTLSPEARERIAEAQRKRWAAARAGK
jgi:hypothetical protein